MKKPIKKVLVITGVTFGFILIALITLPFIFKGKIKDATLKSVNEKLDAIVSVQDVDISLLSTFPYLGINLKQISIFGKNEFAGIPLFSADNFQLGINIISIIKGDKPYTIQKIFLDNPKINIQVLANGKANYDITKPDDPNKPKSEDVKIKLKKYEIQNGEITYNDKSSELAATLLGLNHKGSGDFSSSLFDLSTTTSIEKLSVSKGTMTYLKNAKANLDATILADMLNKKFTFKNNSLSINDLLLNCDGFIKMGDKDIEMDLSLNTPQNSFKNLLSIIPGAYTADYKDVKADGKFSFKALIKGIYNDKSIPGYDININISDASIKYPKLPKEINAINAKVAIINKGNQADQTEININPLNLSIGSNPFNLQFILKTPISDPDVDAKIKGIINLADISQALPMESITGLTGIINADISIKAKNSYVEAGQYDKVQIGGVLNASNFGFTYKPYPSIQIKEVLVKFYPQYITLDNLEGKLGSSDVRGSGRIDNLLAYFSPKLIMKGKFDFKSTYFNANEWLTSDDKKTAKPANKEPDQLKTGDKVFDRFDFTLDGYIGKLLYQTYQLNNTVFKGRITANELQISQFSCLLGNSDIAGSGEIKNMFNWMYKDQTLGGKLVLKSSFFDINQFMQPAGKNSQVNTAKQAVQTDKLEPVSIPAKIDMTIDGNFSKLLYTNMTLENVNGSLKIADQAIRITNCTAQSLGGTVNVSGGYNSKNIEKPGYDVKLALIKVNIQNCFNTFNTFQTLAPIGKFMAGNFNVNMNLAGNLGKDMSPDFNTLSADGLIQTISAVIKGFKPLNDISSKLNIESLKNLELKDTKNWFTIKNGTVELKDFDYKYKDIAMTIGGKHSLKQDMDYKIKAKIPRKLLNQNALGSAANTGLDFLSKEAGKYGVNVNAGEFVNVQIGITGTINSPKLNFKVLGTDGTSPKDQVGAAAGAAFKSTKDSLQKRANQEIDKAKIQAQERAKKITDSLAIIANKKASEAADKLKEKASKEIGDKVGEKSKSEIDKAKDKLKNYDPFKKK